MAYEIPGTTLTFVAAADLSAAQHKFVKMDTDGKIVAIAAVTDRPIGILQDKPNIGQVGQVMVDGVSKLSADAALDESVTIGPSVDGQGAAYAAGVDTTKYIVGIVLKGVGVAGELATVLFDCKAPARGA